MKPSLFQKLLAFSVPMHLSILGWGLVAVATYAFAPHVLEIGLVAVLLSTFSSLYIIAAALLLVIKLEAAEVVQHKTQLSWSVVAMVVAGAALLATVTSLSGSPGVHVLLISSLGLGLLIGSLGAFMLRRPARGSASGET